MHVVSGWRLGLEEKKRVREEKRTKKEVLHSIYTIVYFKIPEGIVPGSI